MTDNDLADILGGAVTAVLLLIFAWYAYRHAQTRRQRIFIVSGLGLFAPIILSLLVLTGAISLSDELVKVGLVSILAVALIISGLGDIYYRGQTPKLSGNSEDKKKAWIASLYTRSSGDHIFKGIIFILFGIFLLVKSMMYLAR